MAEVGKLSGATRFRVAPGWLALGFAMTVAFGGVSAYWFFTVASLLARGESVPFMGWAYLALIVYADISVGFPVLVNCVTNLRFGLVVDAMSFTDASQPFSVGRVQWDEVTGLRLGTDRQRVLQVLVQDGERIVARQPIYKRAACQRSLRRYGTPVVVAVRRLDCSEVELVALFEQRSGHSVTAEV